MRFGIGLAQHIGQRRRQEDAIAVQQIRLSEHAALLVLADGMGGHPAGDLASKLTVDSVVSSMLEAGRADAKALRHAVECANDCLAEEQANDPALEGMGSTCLVTIIGVAGLHWVSVGDCLLFVLRDGHLSRLNADHSMVPVLERMVASGEIDAEAAREHPDRHALMSALTGSPLRLVDAPANPRLLRSGDRILMASDGILSLTLPEIQTALQASHGLDPQGAAHQLLERILSVGAPDQDNISIILVEIHDVAATAPMIQKKEVPVAVKLGLALGIALAVLILLVLIGQKVSAGGGLPI